MDFHLVMRAAAGLGAAAIIGLLAGCGESAAPMETVATVDLARFMGDWYVIAAIPTYLERDAYNAVESYSLRPDGRIQTTFRFRKGSFEGAAKSMHPVGTVRPGTGQAIWGMQFVWPVQAEYRIAYLDPDYRTVIIARSRRDYVWIMARSPVLPELVYRDLVARVESLGYQTAKLRKVPQRWPEASRGG